MKWFKNNKVKFLLGLFTGLMLSIGGAYASQILYASSDTGYDNTNSNLESTNVQDAIDELYGKCSIVSMPDNYSIIENGELLVDGVFYLTSYKTVDDEFSSCVTTTTIGNAYTIDTQLYANAQGNVYGVHAQGYYTGGEYTSSCVPLLDYTIKFSPEYYGNSVYMEIAAYGAARTRAPTLEIYQNGTKIASSSTVNQELFKAITFNIDENTTFRFYASTNGSSNSAWCPHTWAGIRTMRIKPLSGDVE